jgi:RNA polymerase sigma factor (sigma-70 family)
MPPPSLVSVLRHLRRTAGTHAGLDDTALLDRFAADRDEAAFELLVWRHGPMVLGVCRRRLGDVHAAEDAFQATFLALARRAKSIRRAASVAGWLYRVAGRVALAARERSARRTEQPLDGMMPPGREPEPMDAVALRELRQALDDAVGRLPARYRDPLVLTCFGGRSHAEAAQQLGCAVRTIESRLGRARQKLRATLLRRGLLPAGGLAAALAPADAPAGVAASLVMATVRAAGNGTASVAIETLTQGVLHAMLLSKIKIAGAVMFVAGFVGLGTGGVMYQSRAVGQGTAGQPPNVDVAPIPPPPEPSPTKQDRQQRVKELLRELTEALKDDTSVETAHQILKLLDAAADRQRTQREQEIEATLNKIAFDIGRLEALVKGDNYLEKPVANFRDYFNILRMNLSVRAAVKPSGDGQPTNLRDAFYRVKKVDGDLVVIAAGRLAGVADGQLLNIFREKPKRALIGVVKILAVTPTEAIGRVELVPKGPQVEPGDDVWSKPNVPMMPTRYLSEPERP